MLRRKLLIILTSLALLMLGSSLVSVVAMTRALEELEPTTQAAGDSALSPAGPTTDANPTDPALAADRFRRTAIGLAIAHLVLLNISIVVLLRAATLVLRPVDRLVEASRRLASGDHAHRVEVRRHDEFDELGEAFNAMAQTLQTNEAQRIETLHQVARTLNHELNNAIAIIELQLRLVQKSPGYDSASGVQLQRIHEALSHMNKTIVSLKDVRRVVLTEYIEGVQMLDLKLSTQAEGTLEPRPAGPVRTP
ncbi:MAG: HAMP domain-containing protein [Phycisphaerales bacterium]|jgi:HAMP domain-containing protein